MIVGILAAGIWAATSAAGFAGSQAMTTKTGSHRPACDSWEACTIVIPAAPQNQNILEATIQRSSKATLVSDGKRVVSLKTGRYRIVVNDESPDAGFLLGQLNRSPATITGIKFRGRRLMTLNLTPGEWVFFSTSAEGTDFLVTAS
jgi:hypothetical protein